MGNAALNSTESEEIQCKISTQKHVSQYYIDKWYAAIQEFTFKTVFIALDIETAQSIVRYHYRRYGNDNHDQNESDDNNERLTAYNILKKQMNKGKDLKFAIPKDIQLIYALNHKMKMKINECQKIWNTQKLFVRLSNRSSKDGHKIYQQTKYKNNMNKYENVLKKIIEENKVDVDDEKKDVEQEHDLLNYEMIACMQCIYDDLWIDNNEDLLSLLLSSNRIYDDLINHLIVYNHNNAWPWNINIALREFNDNLCDELEFRCFVFNSELTAISQYNKYCYFENLKKNKDDIECALINYWLKISKSINLEDYIIDIALIENKEKHNKHNSNIDKYECIVIEINPFGELTSGCLFDWSIHKGMLMNNIGDITFKTYNNKQQFQKYSIINKNSVQKILNRFGKSNVSWMQYLRQIQ